MTAAAPTRQPIAAPEVTARIVARQHAGQSVAQISRDLHMTPTEVLAVLREAQPTQPDTVAP